MSASDENLGPVTYYDDGQMAKATTTTAEALAAASSSHDNLEIPLVENVPKELEANSESENNDPESVDYESIRVDAIPTTTSKNDLHEGDLLGGFDGEEIQSAPGTLKSKSEIDASAPKFESEKVAGTTEKAKESETTNVHAVDLLVGFLGEEIQVATDTVDNTDENGAKKAENTIGNAIMQGKDQSETTDANNIDLFGGFDVHNTTTTEVIDSTYENSTTVEAINGNESEFPESGKGDLLGKTDGATNSIADIDEGNATVKNDEFDSTQQEIPSITMNNNFCPGANSSSGISNEQMDESLIMAATTNEEVEGITDNALSGGSLEHSESSTLQLVSKEDLNLVDNGTNVDVGKHGAAANNDSESGIDHPFEDVDNLQQASSMIVEQQQRQQNEENDSRQANNNEDATENGVEQTSSTPILSSETFQLKTEQESSHVGKTSGIAAMSDNNADADDARTEEEEEWISMGLGLGDALRQIVALTVEREDAFSMCQKKENECAAQTSLLVEVQSRLESEMNRRAESDAETRKLHEKLKMYEEQLQKYDTMEDDLERAQADIVMMVSEKSKMESEVAKLREMREESERKEAVLSNRLNEAKKKEHNKSTEAGRFEAVNEQLKENLERTTEELDTMTKAKAKLESNMEKLKSKAVERVKQAETALAEERELNEERKKKMKVFVETKAEELREAKETANDMQKELQDTRASLRSSRDREEAVLKELEAVRLKNREIQRDMDRMKRNSEQLHKMGNSFQQELEKSASETEEHKNKRMAAKVRCNLLTCLIIYSFVAILYDLDY